MEHGTEIRVSAAQARITSTPAARSSATPRSGAAESVSTAVTAASGTTSKADAAPIFSPLPST